MAKQLIFFPTGIQMVYSYRASNLLCKREAKTGE